MYKKVFLAMGQCESAISFKFHVEKIGLSLVIFSLQDYFLFLWKVPVVTLWINHASSKNSSFILE